MSFAALLASPNPAFDEDEIAALLRREWDLSGELSELGSSQDQNFRLTTQTGRYVVKVANRATRREDIEVGDEAMRHLASSGFEFEIPEVISSTQGSALIEHEDHLVRVTTWVDGMPLADAGQLDPITLRALGGLAAKCQQMLSGLRGEKFARPLQWEPRQAPRLFDEIAGSITDPDRSEMARRGIEPLMRLLDSDRAAELPVQTVHCDITDYNVVAEPDSEREAWDPIGLIDFGDVVESWRVTEAAHAAMAAIFHNLDDPISGLRSVLGGYVEVTPLTEIEADAIWPIALARAVVCALSSTHQAKLSGAGPHLARLMVEDWAALAALLAVPEPLATAAVRQELGFTPHRGSVAAIQALRSVGQVPIVEGEAQPTPIDLSVGSEALAFGRWSTAAGLSGTFPSTGTPAGRWGEVRLTAAGRPASQVPACLHTGIDLFIEPGRLVLTPVRGTVRSIGDDEIELEAEVAGARLFIRLAGISASVAVGHRAEPGETVGTVAPGSTEIPPHLHFQVSLEPGMPGLVRAAQGSAALAICLDPSPLVGVDLRAASAGSPADESARRQAVVAAPQELYYADPPEIVRGWRSYLYDSDGRPYLDAINNVTLVGHSHPAIAEAANRQLRLLNTNSRFLYKEMADYSERLLTMFPDQLDRVFLVNSGSEAVDLALRLARAYTGRDDVLAVEGAYHGWSTGTFEICSHPLDRPSWREERSPRVHVVTQPDPYRGEAGDAAEPYLRSVEAACSAAERGGGLAAFVSEPLLGSQGGVAPPDGYLRAAYEAVRTSGGVCVADEVQVGFGRTGPDLWAFNHEGVVPDIVCVAKAAGNGYPLGAVICRDEIGQALLENGGFFSSPGGSPLSCAVGSAVIDVLHRERLYDNAAEVGSQIRSAVEALSGQFPSIGAVHGRGLYLGIDLVEDLNTKAPATRLAKRVCERMLSLGVIMQPTGDAGNVLKVKPPLCVDAVDAAHMVSALEIALGDAASTTR